MLFTFQNVYSVAWQLRDTFAGTDNNAVKLVILTYNKVNDNLRIYYYTDMSRVSPLSKDNLILVCYYAPQGDWRKWYGDDWCWDLSAKRIAIDIVNNTLLYNNFNTVNGMDVLPSWLRSDIESWL